MVHNIEEVLTLRGGPPVDVSRLGLAQDLFRRDRFAVATALLTAAVAAAVSGPAILTALSAARVLRP